MTHFGNLQIKINKSEMSFHTYLLTDKKHHSLYTIIGGRSLGSRNLSSIDFELYQFSKYADLALYPHRGVNFSESLSELH